MSSVTDIIVITALSDYAPTCGQPDGPYLSVETLNCYLRQRHCGRELRRVDRFGGGDKGFQAAVYLAAIDWLDYDGFVALFRSIDWELPACVRLLLKHEHDDNFTVYSAESCSVDRDEPVKHAVDEIPAWDEDLPAYML